MAQGLITQTTGLPKEMQQVVDAAAEKVKDKEMLRRFTVAALRYMFQPKISMAMMTKFGESGDMMREVGTGIAALALIVADRSGAKNLTADIVAAGAVELLMHALDALSRAGKIEHPAMEEIGNVCHIMIEKLLDLMKIDDKMIATLGEKTNAMMNDPAQGAALKAKMQEQGMQPPVEQGDGTQPAMEQGGA